MARSRSIDVRSSSITSLIAETMAAPAREDAGDMSLDAPSCPSGRGRCVKAMRTLKRPQKPLQQRVRTFTHIDAVGPGRRYAAKACCASRLWVRDNWGSFAVVSLARFRASRAARRLTRVQSRMFAFGHGVQRKPRPRNATFGSRGVRIRTGGDGWPDAAR
jgi:hypothetical protein